MDGRTERVKEREGWIDGEVKEERDTETDYEMKGETRRDTPTKER